MRLTFMAGALAAASLTGAALVPTTADAQPGGVAAACNIDPNTPKELAVMSLTFQRAKSAANPEDRKKILMGVMKELDTKPQRFEKNLAGFHYTMSQALVMWAVEPGVGAAPARATLGFVTNPTESYDIVDGLDAAFKGIVEAAPACADDVKAMRQNEAWLAVTQSALSASNEGQLDSAEYYAKKSMKLSGVIPYPHYVLANVANARNDKKAALMHWGHVVDLAGSDTTFRDLKHTSMYYIAMNRLEMAGSAEGDEQVTIAKQAAGSFKALLEANPENPEAANLYNGWADAVTMAKDTANISQVYAGLLAAPDKATDISLTMAGVIATRANKADDALKLFELAVQKNPNNRDGLRNLAATYYGKDKFQEMFEPSRKLVAIDPNNYDGWMMFAYAAQGIGKSAKLPAEKKAWTDTLVKYNTIADELPVKVEIAGFTRGGQNASLTLSLEQMAAAGGTYPITVEFLDAAGNVVSSATESSGPLKKGERKDVVIKADGEKIYGYRYKPIK